MNKNKKNAYVCHECGEKIITIDVCDGTTPFMIGCEATPGCNGYMYSCFYDIDQSQEASHEWYKPDSVDHYPKEHRQAMQDHIDAGGLDIRPVQ